MIKQFFLISHSPSLNNLIQLYIGRSFHLWKDSEILPWLERNANSCLNEVDRNPSMVQDYEDKRKKRYQGTPRNIYRHILLSDIKDATATLPQVRNTYPLHSTDEKTFIKCRNWLMPQSCLSILYHPWSRFRATAGLIEPTILLQQPANWKED